LNFAFGEIGYLKCLIHYPIKRSGEGKFIIYMAIILGETWLQVRQSYLQVLWHHYSCGRYDQNS